MDYRTLSFYREIADLALKAGVTLDQCMRKPQQADGGAIERFLQALEHGVGNSDDVAAFQGVYEVYRDVIEQTSNDNVRTVDDLIAAITTLCCDWRVKFKRKDDLEFREILITVLDIHGFCLSRTASAREGDELDFAA